MLSLRSTRFQLAACDGVSLLKRFQRGMTRKRQAGTVAGKQSSKSAAAKAVRVLEVADVQQLEGGSQEGPVLEYEALVPGRLLQRYKRFLGDVELASAAAQPAGAGEQQRHQGGAAAAPTVVHVPNTGPMTGLLGSLPAPVMLSCSSSAKRKYPHTLEWIQPEAQGTWVGVHSAKANAMVARLLSRRLLPGLPPYTSIQTEVKYGSDGKSRVDFVLHGGPQGSTTHVEVKSVTLAEDLPEGGRIALFPDTVSMRAQRHVRELTALARAGGDASAGSGGGAALVFVVQRGDCTAFAPCHEKDPEYTRLVAEAAAAGVAVLAVACRLDVVAGVVRYGGELPVRLDYRHK